MNYLRGLNDADLYGIEIEIEMDLSGSLTANLASFSFSSADFEDADAGSGSMINTKQSVSNILQFHMNDSSTVVPDARDWLRPWRRRLKDILANESELLTTFLERPLEDVSIVQRHSHFIKTLETITLTTDSQWAKDKITPIIDKEGIIAEMEMEIGVSVADLTDNIKSVMNDYMETLKEMFRSVEILNLKIEKLENMKQRLLGISIEDDETEEVLALKKSVVAYIRSEYERNKIQDDYTSFCKQYTRFVALRSVLMSLNVGANNVEGSLCSICMTERVCWALVPCGHTFCNNCAQKQRQVCFVCRTTLRDRQRLYFI